MKTKRLEKTRLQVSIVGLGGANLGLKGENDPYLQHIVTPHKSIADHELGVNTVLTAIDNGVRLIDTAPKYEAGGSEKIVGDALSCRTENENVVVTTKIGCTYPGDGFDHSYGKAMASFHKSCERLNRSHFEIVYLHDPMDYSMDHVMGKNGSMQALRDLQRDGRVENIGIAANDPGAAANYMETGEFSVATISGAWSLIKQKAKERILPVATKYNMGIIITTAIERGVLAHGPIAGVRYLERDFSADCLSRIVEIKKLCEEEKIPLVAVALQWCTRHPLVASVIPGARTPEEALENTLSGEVEIPEKFWEKLDPLIQDF